MKSPQRMSDAGSIPATSTTTGVSGFDGMPSVGGQSAMVPAASGSAWSGVRCDGPNSQTPMTAFIGLLTQLDAPAARSGTQGRHLSNDPNVKPETDARSERASIGTTACASGFGVAFFNGRNAQVDAHDGDILTDALRRMTDAPDSEGWQCVRKPEIDTGPSTLSIASSNHNHESTVGFRRPLLATFYAAAAGKVDPRAMACDCVARHRPGRQRGFNSRQTDATTHSRINARPAAPINAVTQTISVNRAPSLEMVIGVAAPITTSRSYAGHRFANIGHERDPYSVVTPARRALGSWPDRRGHFSFCVHAAYLHTHAW